MITDSLDAESARVAVWQELLTDAAVVFVGMPQTGPGGDAATAARRNGAKVVFDDPAAHPARTLAALERSGASHAVLESARVAVLAAEPTFGFTDLSALRAVLHLGDAVEFGDVPLIPVATGADPHDEVIAAIESVQPVGLTFSHTADFVARLNEAVLASMLFTLQRKGVLTSPKVWYEVAEILDKAGVAERHHAVVERWLTALTDRGMLGRDGSRVLGTIEIDQSVVDNLWRFARDLWVQGLGDEVVMDYFRLNADHLPGLMAGTEQAALLLFPEGRTDVADALYRHTAVARHLNAAVAAAVRALGSPLRIVEIGAGTGATSEVVFSVLGDREVDYLFTDVSAFFLTAAQERFAHHDFVRYAVYDVDNSAPGFAPASADVIIVAGALNNARDTDATLRRLRELLAPGGWLLVIEPTREYLEILISQAFMMTAAEDARLRSGTTFLSRAQWLEALEAAGFTRVHVTPGDDHPLAPMSQYLFAARR